MLAFASPTLASASDEYKLKHLSLGANVGIYKIAEAPTKELELMDLINEYRFENGLRLLKEDMLLSSYAHKYAKEMADVDFFGHNSPVSGSSQERLRNALKNSNWTIAGENLGCYYHDPKAIMEQFKLSPSHNENMLFVAYNTIGIAYYENERGFPFWVVEFARINYVEP
ncbi:MAG: CAP domain-containing protein [Promethearchaeota archaeon]